MKQTYQELGERIDVKEITEEVKQYVQEISLDKVSGLVIIGADFLFFSSINFKNQTNEIVTTYIIILLTIQVLCRVLLLNMIFYKIN